MPPLRPHGISAPATDADDPRLGRWLAASAALRPGTRVALLGFPGDDGVRRNGGRPGAAEAPGAIRRALFGMTPDARLPAFTALLGATVDLGDLAPTGDLDADQRALGEAIAEVLDAGAVPVVLGGGHETAFGHARGYLDHGRPVHLLNWDAHTDVRPLRDGLGHSGSPFAQALGHAPGLARSYTVAGALPWRVASAHAERAHIVWRDELTAERVDALVAGLASGTYASFDLDAVAAGAAPGVSAPGVGGLPVDVWLRAAEACGASPAVASLDLVECSPPLDAPGGRTATLAALTVWHMLRGLARRSD